MRPHLRRFVLPLVLAITAGLGAFQILPLVAWTAPLVPPSRYPALFAVLLCGAYLANHCAGPRRRGWLIATGILCGVLANPLFTLIAVVWAYTYAVVLRAPIAPWCKLCFVVLTFATWWLLCDHAFSSIPAQFPIVSVLGYWFAVSFTFRAVWILVELRSRNFPRDIKASSIFSYFLFAPFFVVVPYMVCIPRFSQIESNLDRPNDLVAKEAPFVLLRGLLWMGALAALQKVIQPEQLIGEYLTAAPWKAVVVALLSYPLGAVVGVIGIATFLQGMVKMFGFDIAPAFDRPLLSRSILEWWQRWNIHFREFLMDIFYYPVLLRYRRKRRLAAVLATASVFLVGSTLFHWLAKHHFRVGTSRNLPISAIVENIFMFGLVTIALLRAKSGGKKIAARPRRSEWPKLAATYFLVFFGVIVLGRGVDYLAYTRQNIAAHQLHNRILGALKANNERLAMQLAQDGRDQIHQSIQVFPRDEPIQQLNQYLARFTYQGDPHARTSGTPSQKPSH